MKKEEIEGIGFYYRGKGGSETFGLKDILLQAKFGNRNFRYLTLLVDFQENSIKLMGHEYSKESEEEVLYEGECLNLLELISILRKTTTFTYTKPKKEMDKLLDRFVEDMNHHPNGYNVWGKIKRKD